MADKKREEVMGRLRNNPLYEQILSNAKDDSQRRMIKAFAEDFLHKFYDGFYKPVTDALEKDPNAIRKSVEDLDKELIKSGVSGSIDR